MKVWKNKSAVDDGAYKHTDHSCRMNGSEIDKEYSYSYTPDITLLSFSGFEQPANQVILSKDRFSNGRRWVECQELTEANSFCSSRSLIRGSRYLIPRSMSLDTLAKRREIILGNGQARRGWDSNIVFTIVRKTGID